MNIATYGIRSLSLDLGLHCIFRWVFIIADVKQPILGADFLRNFGLLVDVRQANFLTLLQAYMCLDSHLQFLPHPLESLASRQMGMRLLCTLDCYLSFLP